MITHNPPLPDQSARRIDIAAGLFLLALAVFHIWYAGQHELLQDEAYYWQWARHLDWGYYDNTPLAALVIRGFVGLAGSTELGVRMGAIVSALVASVFIYLLAKRLLGSPIALLSIVVANIMPLFAAGAVIMTHDPVQLALWAAALYVIHCALTDKPRWWIGAGILAGLAAQAKLNALLLLPGIFLYLLLSPAARGRWLRRPEPYLAGIIALAIFAPFVWWNHTHVNAFWTHIHAMGSRAGMHDPPLKWTLRFLGDQALVLSPLLFLTYLYTLWDAGRRGIKDRDDALLFLWCPSVVVFAAVVAVTLRSKVEANWAVAAYISGSILIAAGLHRAWQSRNAFRRVWVGLSIAVSVLLASAALFPVIIYGPLTVHQSSAQAAAPHWALKAMDRTNELYGWRTLARRVAQEQSAMRLTDGKAPFVFGINYRMPSEAAFYLPGQPQTYSLFLHDRANEYMFWEDPRALVGRDAVFINDTDTQDHFDDLRAVFARVEPQSPLLIYRHPPYGSLPVRTIQVVRCYGFKGYSVASWQQGW